MNRLTKNLSDYLIDEGILRTPAVSGSEPVVFLEVNAPAPEDLKGTAETDITVTLQTNSGFGTRPYEGFLDRRGVNFTYRCKKQKEREIIDLANTIDFMIDDKRAWIMGDIRVEISQLWRPLTFIPVDLEEQGGVYQCEYRFLIRKSELQG